jgi:hypothetical protein
MKRYVSFRLFRLQICMPVAAVQGDDFLRTTVVLTGLQAGALANDTQG